MLNIALSVVQIGLCVVQILLLMKLIKRDDK